MPALSGFFSCDQAHSPQWEACAGTSLVPLRVRTCPQKNPVQTSARQPSCPSFGGRRRLLDPRSKRVQKWNWAFLLDRAMALAIDPLFFYALSIGRGGSVCLNMDGGLAVIVTVLRTCVDAVHLFHVWLQFRLAYVSRESLVVGCGKLVWNPRAVASHYVRSVKGFWFDAFVILPVPQAVFWLVVPKLIEEEQIRDIATILILIFLFQFQPKVYHSISLMRRMQKRRVSGSNVREMSSTGNYLCLGGAGGDSTKITGKPLCFEVKGSFGYGIYQWALPVVSSNSVAVKILYPIFWGLMTLSAGLFAALHFAHRKHPGFLACCNGEEETNAAEISRHGIVDEASAVAVAFETNSSVFRTTEMGNFGGRR
ncbi:Cyclic nucleotide-gated ion channel 2 [Hibiscus syriacus]|uniref:Cyclic nucleotide-gated ion channel 2 n=1 Tax=Hibiscus syriacus TaxID=106335 RepID=A0A6A2Y274_HIBSY|nr:Cyclic nucleotide-gated ion channel 2 [Hibiscus syriacus]